MQNFKEIPIANPRLLNLYQEHSSNTYKIEVLIPHLIEMLELPTFGHMITSTV